jgi:lysophospholipase L1-like esterase
VRTGLFFAAFTTLLACACADAAPYRPRVTPRPAARDEVSAPRVARPAAAGVAAASVVPAQSVPAPNAASTARVAAALATTPARPGDGAALGTSGGGNGALEDLPALEHFFEALARLEDGRAHEDVRIVQFGDSHTAADYETGPLRRALQARFGDGGRGFVAVGHVYPHYTQEGLRVGSTRDFVAERGRWVRGKFTGDGLYGLGGASIATAQPGARAWAELTTRAPRIELSFLEQPRGGSFDVYVDGGRLARVTTAGRNVGSAFKVFDVSDAPHHVEVRALGDGDVRLFGMTVDRPEVGVTLDALGINGARVTTALNWSEAHLVEQLRHRAPELVVLAYGTNEAGDDTTPAAYERQLVDLLGRIARAVPTASCLFLGPPDRAAKDAAGEWATMPKLLEVIDTQRRVAHAAGCAYYSQLYAMGGEGSIVAWVNEPNARATKDHVHLTRDGYAFLASAISTDIVKAYAGWRAERGMPPSTVTPPVPALPSPTPRPPTQVPIARVD